MTVTWVGLSLLYVLSFQTVSQKVDPPRITKLDKQIFLDEFWKAICFGGQSSRSQHLCWFSDTVRYCHCCCLCKPLWVFPAVMPRCRSNASETGVFHITFPRVLAAGRWDFPAWLLVLL